MGRKIFVTYKYGDTQVQTLDGFQVTRVRDYVTLLQDMLDDEDHINMGEADDESLAGFKDEAIESKLRDKIYNSSLTIAMISKGMKVHYTPETDQWIPWEISYSLRESTRSGRTHKSNGLLGLVLPDENGSYEYYIDDNSCPYCNCRTLKTQNLFQIMGDNMFNIKAPVYSDCVHHLPTNRPFMGPASYMPSVKWPDFKVKVNYWLDEIARLRDRIDDYEIVKHVR